MLTSLVGFSPAPSGAEAITLVAPSDSGIYREFAASFERGLQALCGQRRDLEICRRDEPVAFVTIGDGAAARAAGNGELLIPLGSVATQYLADQPELGPTLFTLIPADTYQRLQACCLGADDHPVSAVFVDQPVDQQLRLTRALLPSARRVGVLLGPTSGQHAGEIRISAERLGLEIRMEVISDPQAIGVALRQILRGVDALLAVPDPMVFNSATVANILLASYRHGLPVIGYSEALMRSGAAAAVFADVDQLAETTALKVLAYFESRELPPPGFARDFSIGVNREVLRSLGLQAPAEDRLKRILSEGLP